MTRLQGSKVASVEVESKSGFTEASITSCEVWWLDFLRKRGTVTAPFCI